MQVCGNRLERPMKWFPWLVYLWLFCWSDLTWWHSNFLLTPISTYIHSSKKRITQEWMKRRAAIYYQTEFRLLLETAAIQPRQNKERRRFILMWDGDERQRRWRIHPAASVHFFPRRRRRRNSVKILSPGWVWTWKPPVSRHPSGARWERMGASQTGSIHPSDVGSVCWVTAGFSSEGAAAELTRHRHPPLPPWIQRKYLIAVRPRKTIFFFFLEALGSLILILSFCASERLILDFIF